MALPEGVTTATVTAGVPVSHTGAPVKAFLSIEPSAFLVHTATGTPLVDFLEELDISEGTTGYVTLPHTDQDGFQDEAGNAYKNWYYTARITYSTPSKAKTKPPKPKVFQLATGQTTVDLDKLPSGAPVLPYTAPTATVTSLAGLTGPVTGSQLAALPELTATYAPSWGPSAKYLDTTADFFANPPLTGAALWANSSHLTAAGYAAFYSWALNKPGVFTTNPGNKPIVLLGNSWGDAGGTQFADAVQAKFPGATVVNASVSGNTSNQFLARFDAAVTGSPSYVVFNEPGVNDMLTNKSVATMAANLATLVRKIRALGATPVYLGPVPLSDIPAVSASRAAFMRSLNISAGNFPALTAENVAAISNPMGDTNTAVGKDAQPNVQGTANTAVGKSTQAVLTTGSTNTGMGADSQLALTTGSANTAIGHNTQAAITTSSNNTAFGQAVQQSLTGGGGNTGAGQAAQLVLTTGNDNTALGNYAEAALTTGGGNTAVGTRALYRPAGLSANETTIGSNNTAIGAFTGQTAPGDAAYLVAIGYYATANTYATAVGSNTKAASTGAVAIGVDSGGAGAQATAQNDFVLGTANHKVKVPGRLNVAPRTPTGSADAQGAVGDIATDDNYVYVKTSTGWKRAALTAW